MRCKSPAGDLASQTNACRIPPWSSAETKSFMSVSTRLNGPPRQEAETFDQSRNTV